ncbi:MAG TPA: hypothetical protein VN724_19240, partial [Pyrinomonadaceae bacterium]|nr:hypothetical protein [Pyrinomonadaceae bacterium]
MLEIPPTAVGGSFKSFLQLPQKRLANPANGSWRILQVLSTTPPKEACQSRQRQLADPSSPFYKLPQKRLANPANGSWRIL